MTDWILTLGIMFIVIAIVLLILGYIGKIAWTIGKWLIILFLLLAMGTWVLSVI